MPSLGQLLPSRADARALTAAPRANLLAGVTVAVVALPLALAFGIASGMGVEAGVITAIVGGLIAALLGGSDVQISGPTGAMTVVLLPIMHRFGADGVLLAGLMAGALLLVLAALGVGRFVHLLPLPVIEGFTAGIAAVIALQQLPAALGVPAADSDRVWLLAADAVGAFFADPQLAPILLTTAVAATMLAGARVRPGLPFSLLAVAGATVVSELAGLPVAVIGALPSTLPAPSLDFVQPSAIWDLAPAALAIAALAALESLLSATVADGMKVGPRHNPDRELFGQGIANLVVPMFGGVPSTAAIARTAVNVRAGATSKLAGAVHALTLAAFVGAAAQIVAHIPVAALAGVLIATTVRMIDGSTIRRLFRSTRGDAATLCVTFVLTVGMDLVTAVGVGVALAAAITLRRVAATTSLVSYPLDLSDHSAEEHALLAERIVAYRPEGSLFFGAANRFLTELTEIADVDVVILRLSRISTMDATGAAILRDGITHLQHRGIPVLLSGTSERHLQLLHDAGLEHELTFPDTPSAIEHARALSLVSP